MSISLMMKMTFDWRKTYIPSVSESKPLLDTVRSSVEHSGVSGMHSPCSQVWFPHYPDLCVRSCTLHLWEIGLWNCAHYLPSRIGESLTFLFQHIDRGCYSRNLHPVFVGLGFCCLLDKVPLYSLGWPGIRYTDQAGLRLIESLLTLPLECWD